MSSCQALDMRNSSALRQVPKTVACLPAWTLGRTRSTAGFADRQDESSGTAGRQSDLLSGVVRNGEGGSSDERVPCGGGAVDARAPSRAGGRRKPEPDRHGALLRLE